LAVPLYVGGAVPQPKEDPEMTLAVGVRLPEATFLEKLGDEIREVGSAALFDGRRVVLFGLPGAFTGMCSTRHLPSFIRVADALRAKGVDEIACVAVNDPFVMQVWGETSGAFAAGIRMLSDAGAGFTGRLGDMTFDNPGRGLIGRSRRYALLAEDGVVKVLNVETSRTDCVLSGGETMLAAV
jgi:cytochrome c peroxidase